MKSLNLKSRSDASTLPNIIIVPNVLQRQDALCLGIASYQEVLILMINAWGKQQSILLQETSRKQKFWGNPVGNFRQ